MKNKYVEAQKEVRKILDARENGEWVHCLPFHKNELFGFFNYFYYPLEWKDYRVTHLIMDDKLYEVVERVCKEYINVFDKNIDLLMEKIGYKGVMMGAKVFVSDECKMRGDLSSVTSASIGDRDFCCSSRPIYLHPFDFIDSNKEENNMVIKKLKEALAIMERG